jgi:sigma-B regulation protein RsbU (phosphoserine phosphatase)
LGILNVIAPHREAFGDRELALLTNVGSQMGIALERARLYDLLVERRVQEQAALLDLSNQLLGRLDLNAVMECVVTEARRLVRADASALLLPDGEPGYLSFRASSGWQEDPTAKPVLVAADDDSGPGLVMRNASPVVLADVQEDEAGVCEWAEGLMSSEGFRSHALVPLIANDRSIGILMVDARDPRSVDGDEVRFLQLLANQAAIAIETARMHQEEVERRQLEHELSVAREIQLGLLPAAAPTLDGWEFGVAYEAARQVGGDFYDVFELPGTCGDYGLVVADVADKGVPAALMMAVSRTMIRAIAVDRPEPASALQLANELLLKESQSGLFVTAVLARLDPSSGRLGFANAGHMRPLWVRSTGEIVELTTAGIALGVVAEIGLPEVAIELAPGELVLLFTDGVTDALNPSGERFGARRLRAALTGAVQSGDVSAQLVVTALRAAVAAFVEGADQADDLTVLALSRNRLAGTDAPQDGGCDSAHPPGAA